MKDIPVEVVVIVAMVCIALIAIFAPGPAHSYCADSRDCLVTKPRSDGSLDPEVIRQQPLKLYNQQGEFRGNLSKNPYDPDSTSNAWGTYGSQYSPDSLANPYGAGNSYYGSTVLEED